MVSLELGAVTKQFCSRANDEIQRRDQGPEIGHAMGKKEPKLMEGKAHLLGRNSMNLAAMSNLNLVDLSLPCKTLDSVKTTSFREAIERNMRVLTKLTGVGLFSGDGGTEVWQRLGVLWFFRPAARGKSMNGCGGVRSTPSRGWGIRNREMAPHVFGGVSAYG